MPQIEDVTSPANAANTNLPNTNIVEPNATVRYNSGNDMVTLGPNQQNLYDQRRSTGCSTKCKQSKEDVSISISSDDEAEQAIALNMNKKPNNMYKGMMDIALLTANANQLRFLITYNAEEKTFYFTATLIVLSLLIQIAVGIGMIYKRQIKKKGSSDKADQVGSLVIIGLFCLAVLNVLVVSFTTTSTVVKSTN